MRCASPARRRLVLAIFWRREFAAEGAGAAALAMRDQGRLGEARSPRGVADMDHERAAADRGAVDPFRRLPLDSAPPSPDWSRTGVFLNATASRWIVIGSKRQFTMLRQPGGEL